MIITEIRTRLANRPLKSRRGFETKNMFFLSKLTLFFILRAGAKLNR